MTMWRQQVRVGRAMSLRAMLCAVVVAGGAASLVSAGVACEAEVDRRDDRIRVEKDGSFRNANLVDFGSLSLNHPKGGRLPIPSGVGMSWDLAAGNAVRNRGNGRVAQKIIFSNYGCIKAEALLFVDCTKPNTVLLFGRPDEHMFAGGWRTNIAAIQYPNGPLSVTDSSTVESLTRTARQHGIEYMTDARQLFDQVDKRDRYDVYLGCKLFYPGSPGASG